MQVREDDPISRYELLVLVLVLVLIFLLHSSPRDLDYAESNYEIQGKENPRPTVENIPLKRLTTAILSRSYRTCWGVGWLAG